MAQIVDVKGFGLVEFPDNIERSVMLDALRRKFSQINQGQAVANSTAEPYNPGLAERAASAISSGLQKTGLISDNYRANRIGENITMGLEALPVIGDAIGGDELGRAIREGDIGGIAANSLGAIPVVGDFAPAIFAGVLAKNADLGALSKAKEMELQGADRASIWKETGWLNDRGDWKFEISDNEASFTPGELPIMKIDGEEQDGVGFAKLSEALRHNKLFEAYPQLADMGFATNPKLPFNVLGSYTDEGIELNKTRAQQYVADQQDWVNRQLDPESDDYWEKQAEEAFNKGEYETLEEAKADVKKWLDYDISDLQSMKEKYWDESDVTTTIHELQHAVQSIEWFGRGGNPNTARYAMEKGRDSELQPVSKSKYLFDIAGDKYSTIWAKSYIADLENIVQKKSPKPSEVTNLSDWYEYSSEIRKKFGAEPKKPGPQRDEWVRSAAAFLRNKMVEKAGLVGESSSDLARKLLDERAALRADIRKAKRDMDRYAEGSREYARIEEKYNALKKLSNADLYKRLGGEVEARLTENRIKLNPSERRNQLPWEQIDVPESEIIPSKR